MLGTFMIFLGGFGMGILLGYEMGSIQNKKNVKPSPNNNTIVDSEWDYLENKAWQERENLN